MNLSRPLTHGACTARRARLLACAASLLLTPLLLSGCRHIERPEQEQSLIAEQTLYSPRDASTTQGKLLLLEDGLWALLEPQFPPQPNALVLLEEQDDSSNAQLFVTASTHDWGATLQRLSRGPFDSSATYTVRPISPQKLDWRRHGARACLAPTDCEDHKPQDLIYPINRANLTLTPHHEPRTHHYTLPFHASLLDPVKTPFAPHLQIRTSTGLHSSHGITLDAIALVDEGCSDEALTSLSLPSTLAIRRGKLDELDHPLLVEAAAIRHGADVLLSCDTSRKATTRYHIATPSLARPWLPSRTLSQGSAGPALLSARPVTLSATSPRTVSLLLQGASHTARGRFALAALLFEQALTTSSTYARELDAHALAMAQVIGLESPEQALHIAWHASRASWRRDEVLEFNLTHIAIMHTLGQTNAIIKLENDLPDRASRQRENPLSDWVTWRTLQRMIRDQELRSLDDFKRITPPFHARDKTRDMWDVYTLLGMLLSTTPLTPESLLPIEETLRLRAEKLEQQDLILSLITSDHGLTGCSAHDAPRGCLATFDLYGKNLSAMLTLHPRPLLQAALSLPSLPPYLARKRWSDAHKIAEPLSRIALALATLQEPATQIAPRLGVLQASDGRASSTPLELLTAHAIHRDRPLDWPPHARLARLLETAYTVDKRPADRTLLEEATRSLESSDREAALTLFTYWRAFLLAQPEQAARLETWQLLDRTLPEDAPPTLCANLQLAMSLYHLAAHEPLEARAAEQRAVRCMERLSREASTSNEARDTSMSLEIVQAMLTIEERGTLPATRSQNLEDQLGMLATPFSQHFCAPLLTPDTLPLDALLPPALQSIYGHTQEREEGEDDARPGEELRLLTAGQRKVMAKQMMRQISRALFSPEPSTSTPSEGLAAHVLSQLDLANELAQEARAARLLRRIALVRAILTMEIHPQDASHQQDEPLTILSLRTSPTDEITPRKLSAHHQELLELARSILESPEDRRLASMLDDLSPAARDSAPLSSSCQPNTP